MKITKNQTGFGLLETLLLIVLVGLVGGIGYYVYSQSQKQDATSKPEGSVVTQNNEKNKEVGANDAVLDPTDYLKPIKLPA
jgi:Tfp pilus assembly protein PilV